MIQLNCFPFKFKNRINLKRMQHPTRNGMSGILRNVGYEQDFKSSFSKHFIVTNYDLLFLLLYSYSAYRKPIYFLLPQNMSYLCVVGAMHFVAWTKDFLKPFLCNHNKFIIFNFACGCQIKHEKQVKAKNNYPTFN